MQSVDAGGARLDAKLFIRIYEIAKKIAPPRFLTLRLHTDRYKELYVLADIPQSIQLGPTPGPLGTTIMRVSCIKPPMGVADGVTIKIDDTVPTNRLLFDIHGILELILDNLAI